ncbi:MAG: tail fiber domain-containing protein [Calditrichaeota bacterium]|nr:tail fiber domain-containing protein [Calditrichota bacterium]
MIILLTNSLGFAQDTTFTITPDGMVGIGITSPQKALHVKAVQKEIARFETIDASGNSFFSLQNANGGFANLGRFTNDVDDYFFLDLDGGGFGEMVIRNSGNIGIGTINPSKKLHLHSPTQSDVTLRFDNLATGTEPFADGFEITLESGGDVKFINREDKVMTLQSGGHLSFVTNFGTRMYIRENGNIGVGTVSPDFPLEMASGAHVTSGGVWTNASSREYKENISNLSSEEALSALADLNPVKYNYKTQNDEEYIGFIAEDVPNLVATQDRKSLSPMDIVAVLTKVVQQQQQKIEELEARLNAGQ